MAVATHFAGRLADRGVVVSGGTSGLGLATAERLAAEGARVWILGSRPETVAEALGQLDVIGGSACDVADELAVERALGEALAGLGRLDGAFVAAGIDGEAKPVCELDAEHVRRVLDVNVVGSLLVARTAARAMPAGSALVLCASVNAIRAERAFADYNASKAATVSLAQTMALDLAERRIAVTAICPGYVRTRMTAPYLDDAAVAAELLAGIPAGRFGEPEEVAGLVAYLLSAEAGYLTGSVITMDGGRSV